MRILSTLCCLTILLISYSQAQENTAGPQPAVSLATHNAAVRPLAVDRKKVERIRQIVLHQGEDPRALANLIQLSRDLNPTSAATLYLDLADHYLEQALYNQAGNLLHQLVNQYPTEDVAAKGLLKLVQLYSSSEVNHVQRAKTSSIDDQQSFCKYALHVANESLLKNPQFKSNPALLFQRAVAARGTGRAQLAKGLLTQLKHSPEAQQWRNYSRVEQWLIDGRKDEAPLPVVACRPTKQRPHLDGELNEPMWQVESGIQLTYDDQFLYLAARYPKQANITYQPNNSPRTHDADLTAHDHVRIRLDLDRDYATCYELAIDHRGQTTDRCWRDTSWNPQWFVAAAEDSTHWAVEAAIAWDQLTVDSPQAGYAWVISIERVLPGVQETSVNSVPAATGSAVGNFSLLIFE